MRGKFIVLCGAPNLGKTTQMNMLEEECKKMGISTLRIKYPMYTLSPTGPLINAILRAPETLERTYSDLELQELAAQNRRDFQPQLVDALENGITVLSEDYTITGIAWGMVKGIDMLKLEEINGDLIKPDITILMHADRRFHSGIETNHIFEKAGDDVWQKSADIHMKLGERYGAVLVNAGQTIEEVHQDLCEVALPFLQ